MWYTVETKYILSPDLDSILHNTHAEFPGKYSSLILDRFSKKQDPSGSHPFKPAL
jgi:hypothetical protein